MRRPLFTATFWLDTLERVIAVFVSGLLAILAESQDWPSASQWKVLGIATAIRLLLCILASGIGEPGTASVLNPAPPDTLKDN